MTAQTLRKLVAKATEGGWYVGTMDKPDGYALAWLGNVYIDTHAPKVNGLSRYKDPADDAELIAYLRNHADDFIKLIEAAENVERYLDANRRRMPALSEALAPFKEQP